jgi:hypothetical protein
VENGVKSGGKSPGYFLLITYHPTTIILFFLDAFPTRSCPPIVTGVTAIDLCQSCTPADLLCRRAGKSYIVAGFHPISAGIRDVSDGKHRGLCFFTEICCLSSIIRPITDELCFSQIRHLLAVKWSVDGLFD